MSSLRYSGKFDSGLLYEIHTMSTFSGREELAMVIEGKPAVIISITKKRNGVIEINPVLTQKAHISAETLSKSSELRESEIIPAKIKEE